MKIEEFNPNISEIAEEVLLGPQAEILEKIRNFNLRYGTKVKSTKTFRWSPGVGIELQKAYQKFVLNWGKKYSGVYHFFNRIDNNNYWHVSMRRAINEINNRMTDLRQRGITFQNNSDLVVETFNTIKNKAIEECESVMSMYCNQDLGLEINAYERDHGGYYWHIEYTLTNPMMKIESLNTDGELDHLADIKIYPVVIKFEIEFIDHLNRQASDSNICTYPVAAYAKLLGPSDTVYHPFVYRYIDDNGWAKPCFGELTGDIQKAMFNFDLLAGAMLLNQWTSSFIVNRTQPHHSPNRAYYGLPKYITEQDNSQAYLASFPHDTNICGVPKAIVSIQDDESREASIMLDNTCNSIDCQLKDKCNYWNNVVNVSEDRISNLRHMYNNDSIYILAFNSMDESDESIQKSVQHIIGEEYNEVLCEHNVNLDVELCLECDIASFRDIEEDNMTDEERTLRWVQTTMERRNR